MSEQVPPSGPEVERDLAAEYVLGVLEGPARASVARRLATDASLRAEVEAWEQRLAPLLDEVSPAPAPEGLWARIAQAIEPGANLAPFPARPRLWDRPGPWRAATAMAVAAAAVLAIVVVRAPPTLSPSAQAAGSILAATLKTTDGRPLYVATIDRTRAAVTLVRVGAVDSGSRSPELWLIPVGGKPRPVAVLAGQGALSLPVPSSVRSDAAVKAVLAVSLEPTGGSPTGAPTGPVIATGVIAAV
ncbi:MAG TPA: anti-sigma factor [Caulobacteraceae bacterium]